MANARGNTRFLEEIRAVIGEATEASSAQLHAVMDNHMDRITELYRDVNVIVGSHENRLNRHERELQLLRAASLEIRREIIERLNVAGADGQMDHNRGQDAHGANQGNRTPPRNRQELMNPNPACILGSPSDRSDGRAIRGPGNDNREPCGYCGKVLTKAYVRVHMRERCRRRNLQED